MPDQFSRSLTAVQSQYDKDFTLVHEYYISTENINEALFLLISASLGFILNTLVVACIVLRRSVRKMTNSFIIHGCVLDALKCLYCVPFATSLLRDVAPGFCAALGGSYVVIVTASGFNIVAMVCCEAYAFSEHNVGAEGKGSLCCVVFGVVMVYIGSLIVHLGPTIIGGDFNYNDLIGNCIFVYGTIKSYVVHAMWIVIMTLAMVGAVYYLTYFYRHIQANSSHRLATLVRASVAISRGNINNNQPSIRSVLHHTLSRCRALALITVLFILCWYPLYVLTLVDPRFRQPTKVYKLLTFIAWSNASINPLVLLLFDSSIHSFRTLRCCQFLQRIRRHSTDSNHHNSRLSLPRSSVQIETISQAAGIANPSMNAPGRTPIPLMLAAPDSMYVRVGCHLCNEGLAHCNLLHCNGGSIAPRIANRTMTLQIPYDRCH